MILASINLGQAQPLPGHKSPSGIAKKPVAGPVLLDAQGLMGDAVCNRSVHGGPDQAVYVYGEPDYAAWSELLGRTLPPGTLGENLTVSGLDSRDLAVGDRLQIQEVLLEVTAPRFPCATLAQHMDDPGFVKRFRDVGRPGVYCRVLEGGFLTPGDAVQMTPFAGDRIGMTDLFSDHFHASRDPALLRRWLAAPLAQRLRQELGERLEKLLTA
ncbi:MOSC domain-containing protein [Amphibiibacter pelophylacis]|uniref:MOSC domain-containing protein n=1 Tax=Amphibiibacter pelophylacis TaxID=1799477 RepID=A0ACC6P545_9BURK